MKENLLYSNNEPLRQRNFAVELTDRDAAAFLEMCYRDGTTPAEVLAGFINDLVCGAHTRGSDERMYAQQYFERCCYDLCAPETFLRYLLDSGYLPDIVDCMECRDDAAADLAYYDEHPDDPDGTADFLQDLRDTVQDADAEIQNIYTAYTEHTKQPEALDAALQGVRDYLTELEKMKGE